MRWVILSLLVGCYGPTPPQGAPCGVGDACPSGQRCFDGFCSITAPPGSPDAPVTPETDGPVPSDDAPTSEPMQLRFGERSDAIADTFEDAFLSSGDTDLTNNYGNHADLHLTSGDHDPVLVRIDVNSLPDDKTVIAARLMFRVTFETIADGTHVDVFAMNQSWSEGTGDDTPGVANQFQRRVGLAWDGEGATPPSRSTDAVATSVTGALAVGDLLVVDLPADLVQSWKSGQNGNRGVALIVNGVDFYCELGSSEAEDENNRPVLEVTVQ